MDKRRMIFMSKINTVELGKGLKEILATKKIKVNNVDGKEIVEEFIELVFDRLVDGETVNLFGYGDLVPKTRAARKGRNPQTGEEIQIEEKRAVGFKALKKLNDKLKV